MNMKLSFYFELTDRHEKLAIIKIICCKSYHLNTYLESIPSF